MDSAGIQVYQYSQSALAMAPQWTLSATPVLDIGSGLDDDPRYEFFRVGSVSRLSTGGLVVLNSGTNEIRVYDVAGRYVRDLGRLGDGPGEFAAPLWLHVIADDSVLVFDRRQRRLTVFDPKGDPARTVGVDNLDFGADRWVGMLDDGSFLVRTEASEFRPPSTSRDLRRDSLTYRRFTTTGEELTPFGTFPGREMFWMQDGPTRMIADVLGFGRSFELAVGDSLIHLGPTDQFEIRAYTHAGQLRQILRVDADPVPVTGTMIAEYQRDLDVFGDSALKAAARRLRDAMPMPATTPAFGQLAVDSDQNLWVRRYAVHADSSTIWHVFGPAGRLSGRVELPAGFVPKVIETDVVTGIWTDDVSVEHLRSYELERGR
jgi:hypothetical protein